MFQSSNFTLSDERLNGWRENGMSLSPARADVMTIQGAVNTSLIMTSLCIASAIASGTLLAGQPGLALIGLIVSVVGTAGIGLALLFKPLWARVLGVPFALLEGVFVGLFSVWAMTAMAGTKIGGGNGAGIVYVAGAGTLGVLVTMLVAYKSNIIRATETFKKVMLVAAGGVCLLCIASVVGRLAGIDMSILFGNGWLAIGLTIALLLFASFMLIIDFDRIEQLAATSAPKAMEWYAGYALLATIVMIYIQIVRLIIQLTGRRE
ncbi:MAG: Bax inhibitor-1/YccA family protein [Phycisphaerales bacterium]|nr:Bax inhibitor-1/YccA family protein [Phycisphaerales bacterium]